MIGSDFFRACSKYKLYVQIKLALPLLFMNILALGYEEIFTSLPFSVQAPESQGEIGVHERPLCISAFGVHPCLLEGLTGEWM